MYNEADKSNAILHTKRLQKSNDDLISLLRFQKFRNWLEETSLFFNISNKFHP